MTGAGERPIKINIFGAVAIEGRNGVVDADLLAGQRARAAFAYLVVHRARPVSREGLAEAIWPGETPPTWASAVRSALTRVRAVLRAAGVPEALETDGTMVRLRLPDDVEVDIELAGIAVRAAEAQLDDAASTTDVLQAARFAVGVLDAPLLPDLDREWVDELRRAMYLLLLRAFEALATTAMTVGELGEAIEASERAIAFEPLRESAYRCLMLAHRRAGRRGEALRVYERIRLQLADELGVSPSPETQAVYLALLDVPEWVAPKVASQGTTTLPAALELRDELPFVGRARELDALRAWWTTTTQRPGLAIIRGEPGIGKSRLARELARLAHRDGAQVVYARFDEGHSVFQPFLQLLSNVPTGTALITQLEGTASVRSIANARDEPDRELLLEEIAACLGAKGAHTRLLAVFDDVQWAGPAGVDLIRRLLRREADIDVVVTVRDSGAPIDDPFAALVYEAIGDGQLCTVELSGLEMSAIGELLMALGGGQDDESSQRLAADFLEQSAGNPLFVGEMISYLLNAGEIAVDDAGRWSGSIAGAPGAPGVQGVVMARIGALGNGALDVLAAAAVIGQAFELTVLGDCVDGGLTRAVDVVDEAIRAHLVRSLPDQPGWCRFVHSVVHSTLLRSLTAPRRMALHLRAGRALEANPTIVRSDELARHFVEAAPLGEIERAVRHTADAAATAIRVMAYEDAITLVSRALALPIDERARAELLVLSAEAGNQAGDSVEAHQAFLDAVALARQVGDAVLFARAALGATRGFRGGSEWMPEAERRALAVEALEVVPESEVELRVRFLGQLALWTPGRTERHSLAHQAMTLAGAHARPAVAIAAYGASRIEFWHPLQACERLAFADRVSAAARSLGDRHLAASVGFDSLGDLLQLGELDAVRRTLSDLDGDDAVKVSRRLRWRRRLWDAVLAMVDGRVDDAESSAAAALAEWGAEPHVDGLQAYGNQLAAIRFLRGQATEIVGPMATWVDENPGVPGFRAVLSWVLCEVGRFDEARAHVDALVADGLSGIPHDNTFPITMLAIAQSCAALRDTRLAAELYTAAGPLAGQLVFLPGPSVFMGPADHARGLLAAVLGRHDDAVAHLRAAVELAERTCGPWWAGRSRAQMDAVGG
jgi:DNA-binding SARP family transcriptional activator